MVTREEFRFQAVGQYLAVNPTAKLEDMRTYAEGAIMAWDYFQRKQREEQTIARIAKLEPVKEQR